jgi:CRP-like cAMP-binding protein
LPDEEWEHIFSLLEFKTFKKGEYLFQGKGMVCSSLFFVLSGSVRFYQFIETNKNGEELNLQK